MRANRPWCLVLFLASGLVGISTEGATRSFQLIHEQHSRNGESAGFFYESIQGTERRNNALNRSALLSEDQNDYPAPASGCGPTAMLNILIWYEKYGLISSTNRDSDTAAYKRKLFKEIDQQLADLAGEARSDEIGANSGHVAMVMDRIVEKRSKGKLRVHRDHTEAPLKTRDFLDLIPNFRAGYLVVTPKDRISGELLDLHAATFIRADRSGLITLGTWGKLYIGRLKMRGTEQWFIPQDSEHLELKVERLMTFIPFAPAATHASR